MANSGIAITKLPVVCDSACQPGKTLTHTAKAGLPTQGKAFFTNIFDTADWPARWHCGNWTDFHGWLYILSDLAIGTAYFAIPLLLFLLLKKRKDIPFPRVFWLFIAFIMLCGTTHFLDAVIFWWPAYRLSALVRFATAVVSLFTVYFLYKVLPMIYKIRTQKELEIEIEERKKAEQEAKNHEILKQATEELMAKKDEFMSIASHELKTPITSVKASLQLLERMVAKNDDLKTISPFVTKAVNQTNKLTGIINDLMDVTKIQAGKLELNKTDFNLMELIVESAEQCKAGIDREVLIDGPEDLIINADRRKIDQVVANLLTNAFKYADLQEPVTIRFEKLSADLIKFSVIDKGIGIPAEKIEHIFDRFYRVENTSQNYPGVGLGLYISSEIIKQHRGEIGVESTIGKGSTFWFTI